MGRNLATNVAKLHGSVSRSLSKFGRSLYNLWSVKATRTGLIVLPFSIFIAVILFSWSKQSHSFAMNAFLCLLVFDIIALVGDLLTHSYTYGGKPSILFSFGYSRVEVLNHFAILSLGLFLNLWSLKVFVTLALFDGESEEIHTGRFLPAVILGSISHFAACLGTNMLNKLSKIFCTTTTLQRCAYRIFNSFGLSIPSVSTSLLTPFTTLGVFSASILVILIFALQSGSRYFDFVGGVLILTAIFDAIWPLFKHTAQILVQTIPPHIASQLEKVLRESLTIDGVLEFRNELFWTVSYGQIAGTLQVRIRRDASDQIILVKLHDKLQTIAPHLTIQVIKDDFSRNFGALHIICDVPRATYVSSVMTGKPTEISPIQRPDGNVTMNRMIYSTSSIGQTPINSIASNNSFSLDSPSAHISHANTNNLGGNSSYESVLVDTSPSSHLHESLSLGNIHHHRNLAVAHSRSASLDDTRSARSNPFVLNNSSPPGSQPNILISSANYFGED